jgi:hypothetical protein
VTSLTHWRTVISRFLTLAIPEDPSGQLVKCTLNPVAPFYYVPLYYKYWYFIKTAAFAIPIMDTPAGNYAGQVYDKQETPNLPPSVRNTIKDFDTKCRNWRGISSRYNQVELSCVPLTRSSVGRENRPTGSSTRTMPVRPAPTKTNPAFTLL